VGREDGTDKVKKRTGGMACEGKAKTPLTLLLLLVRAKGERKKGKR